MCAHTCVPFLTTPSMVYQSQDSFFCVSSFSLMHDWKFHFDRVCCFFYCHFVVFFFSAISQNNNDQFTKKPNSLWLHLHVLYWQRFLKRYRKKSKSPYIKAELNFSSKRTHTHARTSHTHHSVHKVSKSARVSTDLLLKRWILLESLSPLSL